jgi:hypothetical protein
MVAKVITESDYTLFAGAVAVNTCLLELLLLVNRLASAYPHTDRLLAPALIFYRGGKELYFTEVSEFAYGKAKPPVHWNCYCFCSCLSPLSLFSLSL